VQVATQVLFYKYDEVKLQVVHWFDPLPKQVRQVISQRNLTTMISLIPQYWSNGSDWVNKVEILIKR
jgi:hypothetical protein